MENLENWGLISLHPLDTETESLRVEAAAEKKGGIGQRKKWLKAKNSYQGLGMGLASQDFA